MLRLSFVPYDDEQPGATTVGDFAGQRAEIYAAPWNRAKYEWLTHHFPRGTAAAIEENARNLGVDDPALAVVLEDMTLLVICGRQGYIVAEYEEEADA